MYISIYYIPLLLVLQLLQTGEANFKNFLICFPLHWKRIMMF